MAFLIHFIFTIYVLTNWFWLRLNPQFYLHLFSLCCWLVSLLLKHGLYLIILWIQFMGSTFGLFVISCALFEKLQISQWLSNFWDPPSIYLWYSWYGWFSYFRLWFCRVYCRWFKSWVPIFHYFFTFLASTTFDELYDLLLQEEYLQKKLFDRSPPIVVMVTTWSSS